MDRDDAQLILRALTESSGPFLRKEAIGVVLDLLLDSEQVAQDIADEHAEAKHNRDAIVAIRDQLGVVVPDGTDPDDWLPAVGDRIDELLGFARYQPMLQAAARLAQFVDEPLSADEVEQLRSYKTAVRTFLRDSAQWVDRG